MGAAEGWEADMHLARAAGSNAFLLDALKGPLIADGADGPGYESRYEAEGFFGRLPPGAEEGGGSPSMPDPSPSNAVAVASSWFGTAGPLLRPGDRLCASGKGFGGVLNGIMEPDPSSPGVFIYDDRFQIRP
jgi:hypothetical protein